MFKKALSLLLALMLVVASFSVAMVSVAAAGDDAADSASDLTVAATSNFFDGSEATFTQADLAAGEGKVTVTYYTKSEERLLNSQWKLTYDSDVLEYDGEANKSVMPNATNAVVNPEPKSVTGVVGNSSDLNTSPLSAEDGGKLAFVTVTFKVKDGASGNTAVNLNVERLRVSKAEGKPSELADETQVVADGETVAEGVVDTESEVTGGKAEPQPTTEPTQGSTAAPGTTAAPETTQAETTAPVADDYYIVAGSEAEIFGTGWDGTNEANLMTKNDDGTFTKDYTVDKEYKDVQLKTVKNGAEWIGDKNGYNVTFDLTGAGTFTVVYDPVENYTYVTGDIVKINTEFVYESVYAAGNGEGAWLNGEAWKPDAAVNKMTKVSEDVWEISFSNVPDGFERQIKFTIDGGWTHNFGGTFEESGVATDAAYNGDNITFDTDDVCTVKAQLDLREFDFASKQGAKFTITIEYGEPEPTTVPETTVPTTEPAPANVFTVVSTSNFFPETRSSYKDLSEYEDENGDVFVTVDYKLKADNQYLINLDVDELTWDPTVLEFKEAYNKYGEGRRAVFTIFPFAYEQGLGAGMVNTFGDNNGGRVVGNYTSVQPAAYATEEDGSPIVLVRAVFKVINREPTTTYVDLKMDTISYCDDDVKEPYSQSVPISGGVIDEEAYAKGTYATIVTPEGEDIPVTTAAPETTVADTTVADTTVADTTVADTTVADTTVADTTGAPAKELTVNATSNYFTLPDGQIVKVGDDVTVAFLAPEDYNIVDFQFGMNYDPEALQLKDVTTFTTDMLINKEAETFKVLGSVTNINTPYAVTKGQQLVVATFTALTDGETTVDARVIDMTIRNAEGEDEAVFVDQKDVRKPAPEPTTAPETTPLSPRLLLLPRVLFPSM